MSREKNEEYIKSIKLAPEYRGTYILINDEIIIAHYQVWKEAYEEGVKRYGKDGDFFVYNSVY